MTAPLPDHRAITTDPNAAFREAEARLFAAFDGLELDRSMFRTPTVSDEDLDALARPVADLPADLVGRYVLKAGTTWGGPDDLRRVAPRALQLAAAQQLPIDRGLLWAKLRWAGWSTWPSPQSSAVGTFVRCEWARLVRAAPRPAHVAHRWLRHAANGVDDLSPYLDDWHDALASEHPPAHHRAATGHLVLLLCNSPLRPDFPATLEDLFPGQDAATAAVQAWLADPRTLRDLERASALLADTSDARRVRTAVERLHRYRARVRTLTT